MSPGPRGSRRLTVALVAMASAWPGLVRAQAPMDLEPGTRIRVTPASASLLPIIGRFSRLTDTILHWQTDSGPRALPVTDIARLERSQGRRMSLPGGIGGFVLGAAAGGALGCLANKDSYGVFCAGQDDTKVIGGAALGGAAGAVLGALIFRRERWTAVPLPR